MATSARVSCSIALFSFLLAVGCTGSPEAIVVGNQGGAYGTRPGGTDAPPTSGAGKDSGKGGSTALSIPADAVTQLALSCGNGKEDVNEQCDDGNKDGGDGCTSFCQKENENEWECPEWGKPCKSSVACGDGKLASSEICDDGNTDGDDGCEPDCQSVLDGWQCRVPGKHCVTLCGDGVLKGGETCDDEDTDNDDGCSSTCQIEPGYDCKDAPSQCTKSVCGNGTKEAGEACDKGEEENGLFYGDGQGCSKTCTAEPNCRPDGKKTQACTTSCGDANIDPGEDCDDGNMSNGDGCSSECKKEDGFDCEEKTTPDTQECPSAPSKQCLVLPVIYRDFDGANVSGGHPDFFFLGANGPDGKKMVCVPNASGDPAAVGTDNKCSSSDKTEKCMGLVKTELGADGKPMLNTSRSGGLKCACRFTDWDGTGIIAGASATSCWDDGGNERKRVGFDSPLMVQVIKDEASFNQWYHKDASVSTEVKGVLELAATSGKLFQFSSSTPGAPAGEAARTVNDDIHAIFMGTQTQLTSGFFPLEDTNRDKVCNIWPYWPSGLQSDSGCKASSGGAVASQWDPEGSYTAKQEGTGGPVAPVKGMMRNFYFTTEVRYLFRFDQEAGGGTLGFFGDDDVWVFINGKLALDLGAPHERIQGKVNVTAKEFGLEDGKTYEIAVFHADRHPRESNYQLTVSGFSTTHTECKAKCGDGTATSGEECDEGENNKPADEAYNSCTTECKYGPFCGDGVTDEDNEEECDNGTKNGAAYNTEGGCTNDCKKVHYCGDGIIDSKYEACDGGSTCKPDCQPIIVTL